MPTDHSDPPMDEYEYVPDAEADTTAVIDSFFEHIGATLPERGLSGDLLVAMRARHEELDAANGHLIVDEPARHTCA